MAYSTPPNFATGAVLTEANLDVLSDDISFLATPPAVRAYNSAAISITTSGIAQVLTANSERYDHDTMHSTTVNTSRLTATTAGKYTFGVWVSFASNATGYRKVVLLKNGVTAIGVIAVPAVNGANTEITFTSDYSMSATDYVEAQVTQTSGGALNADVFEIWAAWVSL